MAPMKCILGVSPKITRRTMLWPFLKLNIYLYTTNTIHSAQSLGKKGEWQSFKVTMSQADHDRALNIKWPTRIRVRPFLARNPKSSAKPSLSGRNPPKQELSSSQQAPRRYRPASQVLQRRKHEKFENYNQYKADRQFTYRSHDYYILWITRLRLLVTWWRLHNYIPTIPTDHVTSTATPPADHKTNTIGDIDHCKLTLSVETFNWSH